MIEIIPAIDLIDGKCVRLTKGDFDTQKVYASDPLEVATRFEDAGLKRLHIVDLDGARTGKPANINVLEKIANNTGLKIDFGGGIKSDAAIDRVFSAGAAMVNIGSMALKEPDLFMSWVEKYGPTAILLGADTRAGNVAVDGWITRTDVPVLDLLLHYADLGVTNVFVTDVENDGALLGPSLELYNRIINALPDIHLIASGGVAKLEDVQKLDQIGCTGVIIGKAIYEGCIALSEFEPYVG